MKTTLTLIALLLTITINAQWNTDTAINTLVADSNAGDMKSLGTSDGKTYVVFWKPVAAPVNYELRVQLLDALGNQLFGSDGALISNTIPMSTFTVIWTISIDSSDNLYVGVTGTGNETGIAYKIDTSGAVLWSVTNPSAQLVHVLPMSDGDAVVAWLDTSNGSASMRRYDSDGNPVWPAVQTIAASSAPADLYEISSGSYVMVFHEIGVGINSTLYAQRFDPDGNEVWANPVQLSDRATAFNAAYSGFADGDVIYYGYTASLGLRFDSYLQRIDPDGTLPWGVNGSDFDTNETNYEMQTAIAFSPGSDYVWSVCTYRNQTQSESGEYVQKFDKVTGQRQFTDNAKQVYSIGSENVHSGNLQLVNDQPLFLIKSGPDNGVLPVSLNACYLDPDGEFVWPEEIKPVATFSASKSRIQFNRPVNGQAVAVFVEDKGTGDKLYAQNFTDPELLSTGSYSLNTLQYLNPVRDLLLIRSSDMINSVQVYDALGRQIGVYKLNWKQGSFNTQAWGAGTYFVKVLFNGGRTESLKIIKE